MKFTRKTNIGIFTAIMATFLLFAGLNVSAQKKMQISATAMGTSTQLGRVINVDLMLNEYSTPEDKQILIEAFLDKGSQGLANALDKMRSKGRAAITGTLGFDVNYIRQFPMPDGGVKIRFVTDRPIGFREVWSSTRSMDYQIAMGEIIIAKDKSKSSGTIIPAALVKLNKENELEIESFQNPWKLVNIKVW